MSRGGRGGGGWRGGRAKPGTARIGGVDISIDDDLDRHLQSNESRPQPGALFPVCLALPCLALVCTLLLTNT